MSESQLNRIYSKEVTQSAEPAPESSSLIYQDEENVVNQKLDLDIVANQMGLLSQAKKILNKQNTRLEDVKDIDKFFDLSKEITQNSILIEQMISESQIAINRMKEKKEDLADLLILADLKTIKTRQITDLTFTNLAFWFCTLVVMLILVIIYSFVPFIWSLFLVLFVEILLLLVFLLLYYLPFLRKRSLRLRLERRKRGYYKSKKP